MTPTPRITPIEVVQVQAENLTPNQWQFALTNLAFDTFVTPLALRALARTAGLDMTYGKAWRTMWAARIVSNAIRHRTIPAARGIPVSALLKQNMAARGRL